MIFNVNSGAGKIPVNVVPSTISSFTYDGEAKSPEWQDYDSEQLTISGSTSATNAGTYTVYFTPKADYEWWDGTSTPKEVSWSIAKANGLLSLSATSGKIEGKSATKTFTVTRSGDGTISVSSSNTSVATVSLSGTTVTITSKGYGSATITVSVAEGTNHKAPSNATYSVTVDYVYLYNAGTQNTAVTGGWQTGTQTFEGVTGAAPTITNNTTSIKITAKSGAKGGIYRTVNKVSLKNATTLRFTGSASGDDENTSGNERCAIMIWSSMGTYMNNNRVAQYYFKQNFSGDATINVGSLTGSYYIGFHVYDGRNVTMQKLRLE